MTSDQAENMIHLLNALVVMSKFGLFGIGAILGLLAGDV